MSREENAELDTFSAVFTSESADDYEYSADTNVVLQIMPSSVCEDIVYKFEYTTEMVKGFPDAWKTYPSFKRVTE